MKKFNYRKAERQIAQKELGKSYDSLNDDDKMYIDMCVHDLASDHYTKQ